jgi:hypothetical protein
LFPELVFSKNDSSGSVFQTETDDIPADLVTLVIDEIMVIDTDGIQFP